LICKLSKKVAAASNGGAEWGRGYVLREPTESEYRSSARDKFAGIIMSSPTVRFG
jgi:hypothetical protein